MASEDKTSFQEIILALSTFWAKQGCVVLSPYDMEVGAGTFHPATTLRALGPRPWSAAYIQPCRRPADGRYGENPNRLQHYYQFQVVMKPNPENIQDLYLQSLQACPIDQPSQGQWPQLWLAQYHRALLAYIACEGHR